MVPLSLDDLAQIESVSRALLSPLAAPDVDAWRAEVTRTARTLFCGDASMFMFPGSGAYLYSPDLPASTLASFQHYLADPAAKRAPSDDPLVLEFFHRRAALGLDVVDFAAVDRALGGRINHSPFHHDAFLTNGIREMSVLYTHTTHVGEPAEAGVAVYYERVLGPEQSARNLAVLRTLLPSFRAGLDALARLAAHRATLDAVTEPLMVFGADGQEVHRNDALARLLDAEPERDQVVLELYGIARRLCPLAIPCHLTRTPAAPAEVVVQTRQGRYGLCGTLLGPGQFGLDGTVTVTPPPPPALPSPEETRERLGLTRREAEIAFLVAKGLSNEEIAERLFVSRHTVRHHVEAVMAKLELTGRGRGTVTAHLLGAGVA